MLNRDWLFYALFGCAVVLGISLGLAIADYSDPAPKRIPYGDAAAARADYEARRKSSTPEDALAWIGSVKRGIQTGVSDQSDTDKGNSDKHHDALDLEVQWAAASAAERMARLTIWQIWIGALGVIAVGLSLLYTRRAVEEASKAARAADESTNLARENFERTERPYLVVFDVMMPHMALDAPWNWAPNYLVYDVANFGKVIGIVDEVYTGLEIRNDSQPPDMQLVNFNHPLFISYVFQPEKQKDKIQCQFTGNVKINNSGMKYTPQIPNGAELYFRILIKYHGISAIGYETECLWLYDPNSQCFVRSNDSKYNRMT